MGEPMLGAEPVPDAGLMTAEVDTTVASETP
jgi:hypothetical protein